MPLDEANQKKPAGVKKKVAAKKKKDVAGAPSEPNLKKRGLFSKDLMVMMYGYGDAEKPFSASVDLLEDMVVDYVTTMAHTAMDHATGRDGKVQPEDILYLVRKDPQKYARAKELLRMNEVIKRAKQSFDDVGPKGLEDDEA